MENDILNFLKERFSDHEFSKEDNQLLMDGDFVCSVWESGIELPPKIQEDANEALKVGLVEQINKELERRR